MRTREGGRGACEDKGGRGACEDKGGREGGM